MALPFRFMHVAALATALFAASAARADDRLRWDPISQRNDAEGNLVWNSSRGSGSSFGLVPALHYEILPQVFADAYLPLTLNIGGRDLDTGLGSATHAALGNPTIGVHYASTKGSFTWFGGGRISLPLAAFHSRGYQYADILASEANAAHDRFLWAPEYLPLSGTIGAEYRAIAPLYVRASLDPMLLIATSSIGYLDGGKHVTIAALQARVEAEARSSFGLGGGLGFVGVFQLTSTPGDRSFMNDDQAQLAINPFISYDNSVFFGRLGLLVALDNPLGFGFDHGGLVPKTAALVLQVGKYLQ